MHGELFDSTIPAGEPELAKSSSYQRYLDEIGDSKPLGAAATRLGPFSTSLQADLKRVEQRDGSSDPVEVVAACIRHRTRVTTYLECAGRVLPLTIFPHERLVHCPIDLAASVEAYMSQLRVMNLEPASVALPSDPESNGPVGDPESYRPMAPLLWALALRGPRHELLSEIAGPAVYRVSPGLTLAGLPAGGGALAAAITRLRRQATSLASIAAWPAFDRERAARLLNGIYLQAGLIVSRSHPDAVRDNWFG